jgi:hypothetical protein
LESLPQIGSRIPSWPSLVWRDLFLPVIPTGAVTQSVAGEVERSAFSVPVFPSRFSLEKHGPLLLRFDWRSRGSPGLARLELELLPARRQ